MAITVAFDVYGTLIDTSGVTTALTEYVGDRAQPFSSLWRDKQLEYSFRRGLMRRYVTFRTCTRQALDYTCEVYGVDLPAASKEGLMGLYGKLPVFGDVREGLKQFAARDYRLFAFSNGLAEDVRGLLGNANIEYFFRDVVSVDEIKSFKPNPDVYTHFLKRVASTGPGAWLVSGNPFDVIGALAAGMKAAWIKRSATQVFDPWDLQPTLTLEGLSGLCEAIARCVETGSPSG